MKKELEEFEKDPETNITLGSLRATIEKIPNWKSPSHDSVHQFWF